MKTRRFQRLRSVLAITSGAAVVYFAANVMFGIGGAGTASAQQTDPFLSRRIDMMEQRFFTIESRIGQLEQSVRSASTSSPRVTNNNDAEVTMLRSQVENLRLRLAEAECGLVHVDERTLTPAAKLARKKAPSGLLDRCRVDPASPIELSARP